MPAKSNDVLLEPSMGLVTTYLVGAKFQREINMEHGIGSVTAFFGALNKHSTDDDRDRNRSVKAVASFWGRPVLKFSDTRD